MFVLMICHYNLYLRCMQIGTEKEEKKTDMSILFHIQQNIGYRLVLENFTKSQPR